MTEGLRKEGRFEEMLRPERSILAEETVRTKALRELGKEGRAGPSPGKGQADECLKEQRCGRRLATKIFVFNSIFTSLNSLQFIMIVYIWCAYAFVYV